MLFKKKKINLLEKSIDNLNNTLEKGNYKRYKNNKRRRYKRK